MHCQWPLEDIEIVRRPQEIGQVSIPKKKRVPPFSSLFNSIGFNANFAGPLVFLSELFHFVQQKIRFEIGFVIEKFLTLTKSFNSKMFTSEEAVFHGFSTPCVFIIITEQQTMIAEKCYYFDHVYEIFFSIIRRKYVFTFCQNIGAPIIFGQMQVLLTYQCYETPFTFEIKFVYLTLLCSIILNMYMIEYIYNKNEISQYYRHLRV